MTTRNRELAGIIDDSGNIIAGGNLTVSGTTTTVSSTVETHADPLIELNTGAGSNSNDLGFVFERGSTGDNACLIWDESNDVFAVGTTTATGTSTGNMSFTAAGLTAAVGTFSSLDISGNADIDGTLEADVITVDGTALNEYIADTVGAMVGSNTETNIAVTYEDGDNTLDFVIGTLNQDTTGTADNITITANNSTDETVYPVFVDGATGSQGAETDTGLTYNPSTGVITSTQFTGNVTGTVTGTATGLAGTPNIAVGTISTTGALTLGDYIEKTSGNLTIDVAGDLYLDADGGDIDFRDGGATFGRITNSSLDFVISSVQDNEDIIFKGVDGGSTITALTLDMSDAGKAIFNSDITTTDNSKMVFGASDDLEIYHIADSINVIRGAPGLVLQTDDTSYGIQMGTYSGGETMFKAVKNGAVSLYYDNAVKLATSSTGIDVTGNITVPNANTIYAGNIYIADRMGHKDDQYTYIDWSANTIDLAGNVIKLKGGSTTGLQELYFNNGLMTLADDASYTITGCRNTGVLIIVGSSKSSGGTTYDTAMFFGDYGTQELVEVADPSNKFSVGTSTDGVCNVGISGNSGVVITNKVGNSSGISIAVIRTQGL